MRWDGKLIHGVGINDADYNVTQIVNGKQVLCPFYAVWRGMIERGYSTKYKQKYPTYAEVIVCSDWTYFSKFKTWMETQDWEGNELDKDILIPGNKVYSPETCIFVTQAVNSFLTNCAEQKGQYPVGVCLHKQSGKFIAACSDLGGGRKHLGSFDSPEDAETAYKEFKEKLAIELASVQTDTRIADALTKRYKVEEIK